MTNEHLLERMGFLRDVIECDRCADWGFWPEEAEDELDVLQHEALDRDLGGL